MTLKLRKTLSWIVKLLLTIILLFLIFRSIDFTTLIILSKRISLFLVFYLTMSSVLKLILQFYNWKISLHINENLSVKNSDLLKSFFIGLSLIFVLPGGAGTFGKAYFLNHSKKSTFASVGVEKIIQGWGNIVFGVWTSFFIFDLFNKYLHLIVAVILTIFPFIISYLHKFINNEKYKIFLKNYQKKITYLIALQTLFIFITTTQYYFILNEFRVISYLKSFISTSLILFSNTIPITMQGLGLRESFAIYFLDKYGFTKEEAVLSALLIFIFNGLIPALFGLFYLIKHKKI